MLLATQHSRANQLARRRQWILAIKLQKRRRKRIPAPAAPVIIHGDFEWDETEEGWADGVMDFSFDHGSFPVASFEVWWAKASDNFQYSLVNTIPSSVEDYRHERATDVPDTLRYKIRYRNGETLGPFSNEREIIVTA